MYQSPAGDTLALASTSGPLSQQARFQDLAQQLLDSAEAVLENQLGMQLGQERVLE